MSIFIDQENSNAQHPTSNAELEGVSGKRHRVGVRPAANALQNIYCLFYNLERSALTMARGGAGEQRPNCMNGLPAAANHAADIALSKLKVENGCSAARNFREHHVIGIFDQLPNDELEKFSHDGK
jgi:hypothetical protein